MAQSDILPDSIGVPHGLRKSMVFIQKGERLEANPFPVSAELGLNTCCAFIRNLNDDPQLVPCWDPMVYHSRRMFIPAALFSTFRGMKEPWWVTL
jgi:hypothetical protein